MKNVWRVYIKPFDDSGNYTDWIDVTSDVEFGQIGSIAVDLDNTEFDIGVYRNSSFALTLRNDHGNYSDVESARSIFRFKRSDSLVKVTWEIEEGGGPLCGIAVVDEAYLSEEETVFVGLLNDDSLTMDLSKQSVTFSVMGRESIFQRTIVPFGTISNGDLFSEVILACLDQPEITGLLGVDVARINVSVDLEIDSIASLQNKTVQEALNKLLLASNSVLFIENDEIFVAPREESVELAYEFFGQGSTLGPENIADINKIKNGLAKTFNYLAWRNESTSTSDASSISKYGSKKREIDFDFITDVTKRQTILASILGEFKTPKQEFDLYTPLDYGTLGVPLLGRVSIDYPTVYIDNGIPFPICGVAICGEAYLPQALWSFTLEPDEYYKVIGRSIDVKAAKIRFKMRAV